METPQKIPNRDITYCHQKDCPKAKTCFRHVSHWKFDDSPYWFMDGEYCKDNGFSEYVKIEEENQ